MQSLKCSRKARRCYGSAAGPSRRRYHPSGCAGGCHDPGLQPGQHRFPRNRHPGDSAPDNRAGRRSPNVECADDRVSLAFLAPWVLALIAVGLDRPVELQRRGRHGSSTQIKKVRSLNIRLSVQSDCDRSDYAAQSGRALPHSKTWRRSCPHYRHAFWSATVLRRFSMQHTPLNTSPTAPTSASLPKEMLPHNVKSIAA
jgi:hypothetical protein